MRLTNGGIGVDKVSFGLTGLNVYGNEKFAEWAKEGLVVHKILNPGDGQMTLVLSKGKKRAPNPPRGDGHKFTHIYSQAERRLLPKFGMTDPIGVAIVGDSLNIVLPEKPKRAQLLRGHHKSTVEKQKQKVAAVSAPNTATTPPPQNTIEKVMRDVINGETKGSPDRVAPAVISPAVAEETTMFEEVRFLVGRLNNLRERLGKDVLRSSATADGSFKATLTVT